MRVAVQVGYVKGCPDCEAIVTRIAASCIPDASCTSFSAAPGRVHAHEVTEGAQALPGLAAGGITQEASTRNEAHTSDASSAQAFDPNETDPMLLPVSDTNGFHPDMVSESLLPNGFEPQ